MISIRQSLAAMVVLALTMVFSGSALAAPTAADCTYRAAFVADVTIQDNTVIPAGEAFVKTWRLRNAGTCAWGPGEAVNTLALFGGSDLGSSVFVPLNGRIGPGQTGDISIKFRAPTTAGTYRSEWKLQQADGTEFGLGATGRTPFYVQIVVRNVAPLPAGQRIEFAPGATTASVQGRVAAQQTRTYLLRALGGQTMTMAIVAANERANFAITGVTDGQPYKRVVLEDRYFSFVLPSTQDYRVDVQSYEGTADYILSVAISPR